MVTDKQSYSDCPTNDEERANNQQQTSVSADKKEEQQKKILRCYGLTYTFISTFY
jgi:hypothetical protein